LETILNGCARVINKPEKNKNFLSYFNSYLFLIDDSNDYQRFLKKDEYIVPDEVFQFYLKAVYGDNSPADGIYLNKNLLNRHKKRNLLGIYMVLN
jgi:hypothetical protein